MLKRFSSCDADGASLFKRASDHETYNWFLHLNGFLASKYKFIEWARGFCGSITNVIGQTRRMIDGFLINNFSVKVDQVTVLKEGK